MTAELWKRRAEENDAWGMFQDREEQRRGRRIKVQPSIACNGETHEFKALNESSASPPRDNDNATHRSGRLTLHGQRRESSVALLFWLAASAAALRESGMRTLSPSYVSTAACHPQIDVGCNTTDYERTMADK